MRFVLARDRWLAACGLALVHHGPICCVQSVGNQGNLSVPRSAWDRTGATLCVASEEARRHRRRRLGPQSGRACGSHAERGNQGNILGPHALRGTARVRRSASRRRRRGRHRRRPPRAAERPGCGSTQSVGTRVTILGPTLCVGPHGCALCVASGGGEASSQAAARGAERPGCGPTQSVGTREIEVIVAAICRIQ